MNHSVTSEREILAAAQQLLLAEGVGALNMRAVAAACGVSVGSIYNYFPSKGVLVGATIESVWIEIFHPFMAGDYDNFDAALAALLTVFADGEARYPGFFSLHALSFATGEKDEGRARMAKLFAMLRTRLMTALAADKDVRDGVFGDVLTPTAFVDYVLTLVIARQLHQYDGIAALQAMVKSCIY